MLGIEWALGLLQAVPKVVAAAPEFKHLWDQLVDTFAGHPAQQDLKDAYAAAVSEAADAHDDLQEIVARHGG
jgi:hypothetical protein